MDDEDFERLSRRKWYVGKTPRGWSYVRTSGGPKKSKIYLHREIMRPPEGMTVDHINRDIFDNRKANLRICTQGENCRNRGKYGGRSKNVHKGVRVRTTKDGSKRYMVTVRLAGPPVYSATFKSEMAAVLAYDMAVKSWHGEFARCNLMSDGAW